jgi:hypothetical protein
MRRKAAGSDRGHPLNGEYGRFSDRASITIVTYRTHAMQGHVPRLFVRGVRRLVVLFRAGGGKWWIRLLAAGLFGGSEPRFCGIYIDKHNYACRSCTSQTRGGGLPDRRRHRTKVGNWLNSIRFTLYYLQKAAMTTCKQRLPRYSTEEPC